MSGWWRSRQRRRLERQLAEVWAEVLGVDAVEPQQNFLSLGGNSISAIKIINRVEELTDMELSIRSLLQTQTVAAMADHLQRQLDARFEASR